jgi:putative MATE family efflux protein
MLTGSRDLTSGPILTGLVSFAVPYLLSNFMQALYGTVDTAVIGWFTDSSGIAGVAIGSQVMWLANALVSGLSMGGTVLIGMYTGAKEERQVSSTIGTMLSLFAILALLLTTAMQLGIRPLLRLLRTPPEAFAKAERYARVASCGILFTFYYNALGAILRGLGNSRTPLVFVTIACVANIFLDLLFVAVIPWGPAGAAFATVLSQALSMSLCVVYLRGKRFAFDFRPSSFRIDWKKARRLLELGVPISAHDTMVSISFLIITSVVNTVGVNATAAVGISGKFNGFAMLPASALAGAIAAMVAQNMGARREDRAEKTLRIGIVFSVCSALVFFGWIQLFPESVMRLFKGSDAVISAGSAYMRAFSWDYLLVAFVFCLNGFFNGCGKTGFSLLNGLLSTFLLRIPLALILGSVISPRLFGIGLAAPFASAASVVVGLVYFASGRWKRGARPGQPLDLAQ